MSKAKTVRTHLEKLSIVKERQAKALERARIAVEKARAALEKAEARVARVEAETPHKIRLAELAIEMQEHRDALKTLRPERPAKTPAQKKAAQENTATTKATKAPQATLTTEDGTTREVSKEAVVVIKAVIGRQRKGILSPLDGEEAQKVLSALDRTGNVGDRFVVSIRGRKALKFTVVSEGLKFEAA